MIHECLGILTRCDHPLGRPGVIKPLGSWEILRMKWAPSMPRSPKTATRSSRIDQRWWQQQVGWILIKSPPSKATRKENGRPLESFGLQNGSDHQRSQRISPGERVTVGDRGPSEEMTRIGQSVMDQHFAALHFVLFTCENTWGIVQVCKNTSIPSHYSWLTGFPGSNPELGSRSP